MAEAFQDKISIETAVEKLKRLVPDKQLLREVFDIWDKAIKTTPEQLAEQKEDIARREKELAQSEKLFKARKAISGGLTTLVEAVQAGNAEAAKDLAKVAVEATLFLDIAEKRHPQLMKTVAAGEQMWPVLTSGEDGWEKEAARRVVCLNLGAEARTFKVRLRQPRGADAHLPARQWAKAAVRTIEETQLRHLSIGGIIDEFGSRAVFLDFLDKGGWRLGNIPQWTDGVSALGRFSRSSLSKWKPVVRKMIREEMTDFHLGAEWAMQRSTAERNGRNTTGEIQNAILDDICSALERIAPAENLPKADC